MGCHVFCWLFRLAPIPDYKTLPPITIKTVDFAATRASEGSLLLLGSWLTEAVRIMVDRGNEEEDRGEGEDEEGRARTSRQESDESSLDLKNYLRDDILETVSMKDFFNYDNSNNSSSIIVTRTYNSSQ